MLIGPNSRHLGVQYLVLVYIDGVYQLPTNLEEEETKSIYERIWELIWEL